jgi:hypothetical protein
MGNLRQKYTDEEWQELMDLVKNTPLPESSREQYENDLLRRQQEHLNNIQNNHNWRPCLHDACTSCFGTGVKRDGSSCIHFISCPCPKCSTYC